MNPLAIAVSTFSDTNGPVVFRGQLPKHLPVIANLGYGGVDLFARWLEEEEIDALNEQFQANDLQVAMFVAIFLSQMGVNLSAKDKGDRLKYVAAYKEQIQIGRRLGAITMPVGYLRGARDEDDPLNHYCRRLAESLHDLCDYAAQLNITLCLEPINRYEINTFNNVEQSLAFIDQYQLHDLGLLLDTFHMNIEDASIEQAILQAGGKVKHVHAPDSNRYAAGSGHLDYAAILQALNSVNYSGYLSLEAFPEPDPLSCATSSVQFFKSKQGEPAMKAPEKV